MEYMKNPLYGKKIVFDGDSICHGNLECGRIPGPDISRHLFLCTMTSLQLTNCMSAGTVVKL